MSGELMSRKQISGVQKHGRDAACSVPTMLLHLTLLLIYLSLGIV